MEILCIQGRVPSSALKELMRPVNNERNHIHADTASEQLLERYLLQYNYLLFNCELQDRMYYQFVIVVLIRAGANLILKILWKLIVDKKKEHLDSQYNTLKQNTEVKDNQPKKLQTPAHKQINLSQQIGHTD